MEECRGSYFSWSQKDDSKMSMCLYKLFPLINGNEEGSSVSIRIFFSNIHVIKMHAVISRIIYKWNKGLLFGGFRGKKLKYISTE
jgi:hypothetical protein